MRPLLCK